MDQSAFSISILFIFAYAFYTRKANPLYISAFLSNILALIIYNQISGGYNYLGYKFHSNDIFFYLQAIQSFSDYFNNKIAYEDVIFLSTPITLTLGIVFSTFSSEIFAILIIKLLNIYCLVWTQRMVFSFFEGRSDYPRLFQISAFLIFMTSISYFALFGVRDMILVCLTIVFIRHLCVSKNLSVLFLTGVIILGLRPHFAASLVFGYVFASLPIILLNNSCSRFILMIFSILLFPVLTNSSIINFGGAFSEFLTQFFIKFCGLEFLFTPDVRSQPLALKDMFRFFLPDRILFCLFSVALFLWGFSGRKQLASDELRLRIFFLFSFIFYISVATVFGWSSWRQNLPFLGLFMPLLIPFLYSFIGFFNKIKNIKN